MAGTGPGVEDLTPHRPIGHQLLHHRLGSADVPRRQGWQPFYRTLVAVQLVKIRTFNFVSHTRYATPCSGMRLPRKRADVSDPPVSVVNIESTGAPFNGHRDQPPSTGATCLQ